jgi:hypothetical protein
MNGHDKFLRGDILADGMQDGSRGSFLQGHAIQVGEIVNMNRRPAVLASSNEFASPKSPGELDPSAYRQGQARWLAIVLEPRGANHDAAHTARVQNLSLETRHPGKTRERA